MTDAQKRQELLAEIRRRLREMPKGPERERLKAAYFGFTYGASADTYRRWLDAHDSTHAPTKEKEGKENV